MGDVCTTEGTDCRFQQFTLQKYHHRGRNSFWNSLPFRKRSTNIIVGVVVCLIFFSSLKLHSGTLYLHSSLTQARVNDLHHQFNYFASFIVPSETALDSIQDSFLRKHIKEISLDKYEGRATGTKGEQATVDYLEEEMKKLHPHIQTKRQNVPMTSLTLDLKSSRAKLNNVDLIPNEDIWINLDTPLDAIEVTIKEFIFIGYGIQSKSYHWDDYKDVDVRGKFLLAFVNEPTSDFKGKELTYFGRWMYKLDEARRRGARGILFVHTEETAGYPFTVITSQTEMVTLETTQKSSLELWGWISENTATKIIKDFHQLSSLVNSRNFKPFEISTNFHLDLTFQIKKINGINLIGWIPGLSDETIVYSAHHDHLGTGVPSKSGDRIYNGALDNASGLSMLLSIINAFAHIEEPPRRNIAFICFTGEENGLLGSLYYIQNMRFTKTVANINFDIGNVHGKTLDIVGLGYDKSDLGMLWEAVAAEEDLTVSPDPRPEQGSFYRADSFAFAKAGIPSIYPWTGMYFVNQPSDYYLKVRDNYVKNDYHKQSDEYDESWSMEGMIQQVRVSFRLGYVLSNTNVKVSYYKEDLESFNPANVKM